MAAPVKRVLIVTGQKPIAQVPQKSGGSSTLYEVYATDEDGATIEEPLRTFAELEEGVPIEYEISRYNHPQYGTSYTLTPPKRNSFKRLRDLEETVELLVRWAEGKGFSRAELATLVKDDKERERLKEEAAEDREQRNAEIAAMEPVPGPGDPDMDEKFGAEAPWSDADLDLTPPDDGESGEPDGQT